MKTIKDIDLKNKKVVIRVDYNVPMENGIIKDSSKINKSLRSINYLLENNCRVVILSHFGRIKSEEDKAKNSLKIVAKELANLLGKNVKFFLPLRAFCTNFWLFPYFLVVRPQRGKKALLPAGTRLASPP